MTYPGYYPYGQNNELTLGQKIMVGLVIGGLITLVVGSFVAAIYFTRQDYEKTNSLSVNLKDRGFSVVIGTTDSPTVIQNVNDFPEFIRLATKDDVTVIYQLSKSPPTFFFVTNSTYGCEYKP